jgi:peptidoglycan lytic transglycosylase G
MFREKIHIRSRYFSLLLLLLLLAAGFGAVVIGWLRPYRNYPGSEKFILIARGASSYEIARQLEREGIVSHWAWFLSYIKTVKRSHPLQAGEYHFDVPVSIPQVADKLIRGLIFYHEITVPEGYSLFDILELLELNGFATPETFWAAAARVELISDLAPGLKNLEGFLFPDTYRLSRGTTPDEIIRQMVERFRHVYAERFEAVIEQNSLSLKEVVTLASLIEKETGLDEERELVSAVFRNRLKRQIPLQCDPTVIYAAKLDGKFRGEIYQSDLDSRSPYNTYRYVGLPPAPIANPGIRAMEAALRPAKVDYLYFVSNNRGGHVFSVTLDQHNRAVATYRSGVRQETNKTFQQKQGRL